MNSLVFISSNFKRAANALLGIVGWLIGGGSVGGTAAGLVNGIGTTARFRSPNFLTTDTSGNLFISDSGNNVIRKVIISSATASTLAGSPIGGGGGAGYVDGTGTNAMFNKPAGIAYDGSGNLFVADLNNNAIRQVVISTGVVTTLAGGGGAGSADGVGVSASFNGPRGMCYDGAGNLFVTDGLNNMIRKIVISTATVTTFAGQLASGSTNATGTNAKFNNPYSICYAEGNFYVGDDLNNSIRKITPSAVVSTLTSSIVEAYDICGDNAGNLYCAISLSIRKYLISTGVFTNFAGQSSISGFVNGVGTNAKFNAPRGLVMSSDKTKLYVSDQDNNVIRVIT